MIHFVKYLAKYNKANAIKKRRKKKKKKQVTYNQQSGDQNLEVEQDQDLCTTDSESETSQDEVLSFFGHCRCSGSNFYTELNCV